MAQNRLISNFFIAGSSQTSLEPKTPQDKAKGNRPEIFFSYPELKEGISKGIIEFIFQNEAPPISTRKKPKFSSFILTNEKGTRSYISILYLSESVGSKYLPYFLCIISPISSVSFRPLMIEFLNVINSADPSLNKETLINFHNAEIMQMIAFIAEITIPPPMSIIRLKFHFSQIEFNFASLMTIPKNQNIKILFDCIELSSIIKIWCSLLSEKHVILISDQSYLLFIICDALMSLIFPFKWFHTYIATLPSGQLDYLESPTPYLMGVLNSSETSFAKLSENYPGNVVVDVNSNMVNKNAVSYLGEKEESELRKKIQLIKHKYLFSIEEIEKEEAYEAQFPVEDIQAAFFDVVKGTLVEIKQYSVTQSKLFNVQEFLDSHCTESMRDFWEKVTSTIAFEQFLISLTDIESDDTTRIVNILSDNKIKNEPLIIEYELPKTLDALFHADDSESDDPDDEGVKVDYALSLNKLCGFSCNITAKEKRQKWKRKCKNRGESKHNNLSYDILIPNGVALSSSISSQENKSSIKTKVSMKKEESYFYIYNPKYSFIDFFSKPKASFIASSYKEKFSDYSTVLLNDITKIVEIEENASESSQSGNNTKEKLNPERVLMTFNSKNIPQYFLYVIHLVINYSLTEKNEITKMTLLDLFETAHLKNPNDFPHSSFSNFLNFFNYNDLISLVSKRMELKSHPLLFAMITKKMSELNDTPLKSSPKTFRRRSTISLKRMGSVKLTADGEKIIQYLQGSSSKSVIRINVINSSSHHLSPSVKDALFLIESISLEILKLVVKYKLHNQSMITVSSYISIINTPEFTSVKNLISELALIQLGEKLSNNLLISFWLNAYNFLTIFSLIFKREIPLTYYDWLRFQRGSLFNIAGELISLFDIENSILLGEIESKFLIDEMNKYLRYGISIPSKSSPKLQIYFPNTINNQLKQNTVNYFSREVLLQNGSLKVNEYITLCDEDFFKNISSYTDVLPNEVVEFISKNKNYLTIVTKYNWEISFENSV